MEKLKVIYMGTPEFSLKPLEELIKNTNVDLVVTNKDAPYGRKRELKPSPVKLLAKSYNIEVFTPDNIKTDYEKIINLKPDIIITCAYGQFIPKEVLDTPKYGCINIHASLLPKYRGGAPIHHAILNGDKKTGITIMYMDEKMDSGDIIYQEEIEITNEDNIKTLEEKLSLLGSKMIIKILPEIINKTNKREKQNINEVTFAPIIKREDEKIDFNKTAKEVYNLYQAMSPDPLPYFTVDNMEYKIGKCTIQDKKGKTNTIIEVDKTSMVIMAKDKAINITEIKPKGKKLMKVSDFFNGTEKESFLNKEVNK